MNGATLCSWILLVFIVPSPLCGIASDRKSACVQEQGHTLLSTTYRNYCSDEFWNSSGKRCSAHNDFKKYAYTFYLEYGLTYRDTLSANGAWVKIDESINGRNFGIEDFEIGWKHCFGTKWCHLVSAEILAIIPADRKHKPGLRYGQYGGEFDLLCSRGFSVWDRRGSYDLMIGYRKYEGFPSDQLRAQAMVNFFPFSRLQITGSSHLEYGLFNGSSRTDESLFLLNPNYRLLRSQIDVVLCLYKGASIFVGYHRHLWGRNVGTEGGMYGGTQIQF